MSEARLRQDGGWFVAGAISSGSIEGGVYGAFSAGVFQGIGGHFEGLRSASSTGTLSAAQTVAKIGSHAIAGGIMSCLQGVKFGHGFASAGVTAGEQKSLASDQLVIEIMLIRRMMSFLYMLILVSMYMFADGVTEERTNSGWATLVSLVFVAVTLLMLYWSLRAAEKLTSTPLTRVLACFGVLVTAPISFLVLVNLDLSSHKEMMN